MAQLKMYKSQACTKFQDVGEAENLEGEIMKVVFSVEPQHIGLMIDLKSQVLRLFDSGWRVRRGRCHSPKYSIIILTIHPDSRRKGGIHGICFVPGGWEMTMTSGIFLCLAGGLSLFVSSRSNEKNSSNFV